MPKNVILNGASMFRLFRSLGATLLSLFALLALGTAAHAQNVDTRATATTGVSEFGKEGTPTYGQTITVPAGSTQITSFSFVMNTVPSTVTFEGVIMAWDGTKVTGPVLYRSALQSTTGATPQEIIFTPTTPVSVTSGATYVLFASAVNGTGPGWGEWAAEVSPGSYAGGQYVYTNAATEAAWSATWETPYIDTDVGFTVNFNADPVVTVPTMTEWALILFGMILAGGAALMAQRRRMTV